MAHSQVPTWVRFEWWQLLLTLGHNKAQTIDLKAAAAKRPHLPMNDWGFTEVWQMYAVCGVEPKANYSQFFPKIFALSPLGTGNQALYYKTKFCAPETLENNMTFEFSYFMTEIWCFTPVMEMHRCSCTYPHSCKDNHILHIYYNSSPHDQKIQTFQASFHQLYSVGSL